MKGGSFYVQSKVWSAKEELLKEFPGYDKEYYAKHGLDEHGYPKEEKEGEQKEEGKEKAKEEEKKDEAKK